SAGDDRERLDKGRLRSDGQRWGSELCPFYTYESFLRGLPTGRRNSLYGAAPSVSLTSVERCAVPINGEISKVFGVFKTVCCDAEIIISIGAPFPDCPNHKNLPTEWKQILDADPNEYKPNAAGKINLSRRSRSTS